MNIIDLSSYDSSASSVDILDSIKHAKNNALSIENLSHKVNIDNKLVICDENLLHQYKDYLSQYCVTVSLPEKFYYHPELVAKELYGSVDLWYLVFWFNDIPSFEEYNVSKIRVFDPNYFNVINRLLQTNKDYLANNNKNPEVISNCKLKNVRIKGNQLL